MKSVNVAISLLTMLLLVVVGCTDKPAAIAAPDNLLPRDTFVTVLMEVRLLEGAYSTSYERVDTSEFPITAHYNRLFNRHHLTKEQYLNAYVYYSMNAEEMLEIESDVALRLEQMKWSRDSVADVSR
jgi:hypothetical protein